MPLRIATSGNWSQQLHAVIPSTYDAIWNNTCCNWSQQLHAATPCMHASRFESVQNCNGKRILAQTLHAWSAGNVCTACMFAWDVCSRCFWDVLWHVWKLGCCAYDHSVCPLLGRLKLCHDLSCRAYSMFATQLSFMCSPVWVHCRRYEVSAAKNKAMGLAWIRSIQSHGIHILSATQFSCLLLQCQRLCPFTVKASWHTATDSQSRTFHDKLLLMLLYWVVQYLMRRCWCSLYLSWAWDRMIIIDYCYLNP